MAETWAGALQNVYYDKNWTVGELRELLGGSTKATAAALGVSTRQIARYIAYEEGRPVQARSTKRVHGKINDAVKAAKDEQRGAAAGQGGTINLSGTIGVNGIGEEYERDRDIEWNLSEDELEELARLADEFGEEAAWAEFAADYGVHLMYMVEGTIELS
jgi:hypothetical protein